MGGEGEIKGAVEDLGRQNITEQHLMENTRTKGTNP